MEEDEFEGSRHAVSDPADESPPQAIPAFRRMLNYMELDPILEEEGLSAKEGYTYQEKLASTQSVLQLINKTLIALFGSFFALKLMQLALFVMQHHADNPHFIGFFVATAALALALLLAAAAAVHFTKRRDFYSGLKRVYLLSFAVVALEVAFIIVSAVQTFREVTPRLHEEAQEGEREPSLLLGGPLIIGIAALCTPSW